MKFSTRIQTAAAFLLLWGTAAVAQPTFINPIPIPPLIDAGEGTINLEMRITTHKFNPGNPSSQLNGTSLQPDGITAYAYNAAGDSTMTLLGPTLKWHTYATTSITVTNLIGAPTTTHWHGAEVPVQMDGGPHQGIDPGATWSVDFTTLDSASTMWYHPHFHNTTLEQVQKGLSGMIIVEEPGDPIAGTLPRTYGVDDVPVIIGDLGIITDTANSDTTIVIDSAKGKRPFNIVNGVTNPYVEVPAHMVRLRILNGSTRKGMLFGFSQSYNAPLSDPIPFYLIAGDGGYTMKPDTLTQLLTGPGIRTEVLLDLSGFSPGDTLYLTNLKELLPGYIIGSPQTAPNGGGQDGTIGNAFLQLRIVEDSKFKDYTPVTTFTPFTRTWSPGLADTQNVVQHRLKELVGGGPGQGFTINGNPYDMEVINDTVCVDTKEIWTIQNKSNTAHPFHIHKIQFRVLDVTDSMGNEIDLEAYGLNSPKDDVLVLPGWTLRFLGQFDDYPSHIMPMNTYMYHCHILPHEDSIGGGMMQQFVVTDMGPCISSSVEEEKVLPAMVLVTNSAAGTLQLRGSAGGESTVTISDMQGRRLRREGLPPFNGAATIDIGGLPSGPYVVEWETETGRATGKIVVAR